MGEVPARRQSEGLRAWRPLLENVLTFAVRALPPSPGFQPGAIGFRLGAFGLGRLSVVDLSLVAPPGTPSAHVQVSVTELAGAFGGWRQVHQERGENQRAALADGLMMIKMTLALQKELYWNPADELVSGRLLTACLRFSPQTFNIHTHASNRFILQTKTCDIIKTRRIFPSKCV